jgi:hypothetical protein
VLSPGFSDRLLQPLIGVRSGSANKERRAVRLDDAARHIVNP